jgi:hypothetical protein
LSGERFPESRFSRDTCGTRKVGKLKLELEKEKEISIKERISIEFKLQVGHYRSEQVIPLKK